MLFIPPEVPEEVAEEIKKSAAEFRHGFEMGYDAGLKSRCYDPVMYPEIRNVEYRGPSTTIYWFDGTVTSVTVQEGDTYSKEAGFNIACNQKLHGGKSEYTEFTEKWCPEDD